MSSQADEKDKTPTADHLDFYNLKPLCKPCELEHKQESAFGYCQDCMEHLCEICYNTHKRPAPCRDHTLLPKSKMPKSACLDQNRFIKCEQHAGRVLEYHCKTHNIFGCSPCITLNHRNCQVLYISEVANRFATSIEYKNILKQIRSIENICQSVTIQTEEIEDQIDKRTHGNATEIKQFKQCIDIILCTWENNLYEENERLHSDAKAVAASIQSTSKEIQEKVEQIHEHLRLLKETRNHRMLYIRAKQDATMLRKYEEEVKGMQNSLTNEEYVFTPNEDIQKIISNESNLGVILAQKNKKKQSKQNRLRQEKFFRHEEVDGKLDRPSEPTVNLSKLLGKPKERFYNKQDSSDDYRNRSGSCGDLRQPEEKRDRGLLMFERLRSRSRERSPERRAGSERDLRKTGLDFFFS